MKTILLLTGTLCLLNLNAQENEIPDQGNVGIGTTEPTEKLDVRGSARIDSALMVGNSLEVTRGAVIKEDLTVQGQIFAEQSLTVQQMLKLGGTQPYGQSINGYELLLRRTENGEVRRVSLDAIREVMYGKYCNTVNGIVASPTWANGENRVYIGCPQVRVGIGTDLPTHNLHTVGNALFQGTVQLNTNTAIGTAPSGFSKLKISNQNNGAALEIDQAGNEIPYNKMIMLNFTNPQTELIKTMNTQSNHSPFTVLGSGKLILHNGVRKTFQVTEEGIVLARRVRCDSDNWADYVFEPGYKLMPIGLLESYISENRHLPNIPSAEDVIAHGLDLGEMDRLLLEKVEELTLYILQQEKKIDALNEELGSMKTRFDLLQSEKQ